jgi:hypothetical protein
MKDIIEMISPKEARAMYKNRPKSRALKEAKIKELTRRMKKGKYA